MSSFVKTGRKKRRVLIVDDELINRELLETILGFNYDVTTVTCGMDAMDVLHKEPNAFSLILLDIIMPKMSGFDVIEACKSDDALKEIPIIVMTTEKSAEVRSIRLGAADFIAKPYRMPEVIIARCERIIDQSEERQLIRSIEKDHVTGLYIKLFFDAYMERLAPDVRGVMDAVALKIDGLELLRNQQSRDAVLKKIANLMTNSIIGTKGIGCRAQDDLFFGYCRHKMNYEELIGQIAQALDDDALASGIRLRAGICERTDKSEPIGTWFDKAVSAYESVSAVEGHFTAVCS